MRHFLKCIFISLFIFQFYTIAHATNLKSEANNLQIAVGIYDDSTIMSHHALVLVSHDNAEGWSYVNNIIGVPSELASDLLRNVQCTGNTCIIGGGGFSMKTVPYLLVSHDNGDSWFYPHSIKGIPSSAFNIEFNATHCIDTHCMAAASYHEFATCNRPLFLTSQDRGISWSASEIKNLPRIKNDCVIPNFIECENSRCIAGGTYVTGPLKLQMFALFVSNDKGKSWAFVDKSKMTNVPVNLNTSFLSSGNCLGDSCTFVGYYTQKGTYNEFPLILNTENAGDSWAVADIVKGIPAKKEVNYDFIDCDTHSCVVTGTADEIIDIETIQEPFIMTSFDRTHWTIVNAIKDYPNNVITSHFDALHCAENSCFIFGSLKQVNHQDKDSFFLMSRDRGQTWMYSQAITGIPDNATSIRISKIKCKNNICVAAGSYNTDFSVSFPLLLNSSDNGLTWHGMTHFKNLPDVSDGFLMDLLIS